MFLNHNKKYAAIVTQWQACNYRRNGSVFDFFYYLLILSLLRSGNKVKHDVCFRLSTRNASIWRKEGIIVS